jgi:PST family polysaccharide transporter
MNRIILSLIKICKLIKIILILTRIKARNAIFTIPNFNTKSIIINVAFTREFSGINELLIWQLAGDFIKIITLAFGFQIVVKTMMKRYFIGEIAFNLSYFLLAVYLMKKFSVEGVLQAYFYANLVCLVLVLFMFRKLFFKR